MATDPLRSLNCPVARAAVGLKTAVVIEETGQGLVRWARDA